MQTTLNGWRGGQPASVHGIFKEDLTGGAVVGQIR